MTRRASVLYSLILALAMVGCEKGTPAAEDTIRPVDEKAEDSTTVGIPPVTTENPDNELSYGDSIFYIKEKTETYIINPVKPKAGRYIAFPDGLELNELTGAITISESETGLRYRVSYISPDNDTASTIITLSGINYLDQYYNLSKGDSIATPIYDGDLKKPLPCANGDCSFDEGNLANGSGCSLKTTDGDINLAETVRNGFFGKVPKNNERFEVPVQYRLSDKSHRALNQVRVKLYYYETMDDVAADLKATLQERDGALLGISSPALGAMHTFNHPLAEGLLTGIAETAGIKKVSRPRPPCIIVIAR